MLEAVGLSHRLQHRPGQLSGGEQQRVAIARAMVTEPAIVIADEPTGNLDAANGDKLLALIADLQAQSNTTFLIATHDADVASHAARQLKLSDGLLVDGAEPR